MRTNYSSSRTDTPPSPGNIEAKIPETMILKEGVPDILPENILKLKAAYRHPFEYINPRLYQKKKSGGSALENETQN